MGFMDKVKNVGGQVAAKAQQVGTQGKAKLDEVQAKRQWDALLRNLGAAVYAQQRQGGSADAVSAAMDALDQHAAAHGAGATGAVAVEAQPPAGEPAMSAPAAPSPASTATAGDYSIEDV
ncbi:MAG TPA: hypothetical protein VED59_01740 [Acidimicrobiales bacterium]|nr:hypothetical protein [Acidimicrobiales bacterium]